MTTGEISFAAAPVSVPKSRWVGRLFAIAEFFLSSITKTYVAQKFFPRPYDTLPSCSTKVSIESIALTLPRTKYLYEVKEKTSLSKSPYGISV